MESNTSQQGIKRKRRLFSVVRKMSRLSLLLWPHARNYKGMLFLGSTLSILLIIFRLAQPWPLKWIVDQLADKSGIPVWLSISSGYLIPVLSLMYILISLLAGTTEYWQRILLAGIGNRVIYSFRNQAFAHLFRLPLSFHEKRTVGELVTRVVYDTSRLRRGVNGILIRTFQVVLTFLFNVVVIVLLSWQIAIIIGVTGSAAMLIMNRNGKRILSESRKNRRREGQLAAIVSEDLHGIREIQTLTPARVTDPRFEKSNKKSMSNEQKVRRIEASMSAEIEILLAAGICVILWIGSVAVQGGQLSVGTLVLILHYAAGLFGPFRQFSRQAAQTGRTIACAERLTRIIQKETSIKDAPEAVPLTADPLTINYSAVSVKSSRRRRAGRKWMLKNISFEVNKGERVAVIGQNGAGKSTLIKLLLRLADPQNGQILFDGKDIKSFTLESLRNNISVVFQDSVFFGLSIRENIAFGNKIEAPGILEQAADKCGMKDWVNGLKKGLDTPVRRQGSTFSGGEKQKIAIARALLRNGSIWLLDEPTNDLDELSRDIIIKLLLEITENRTTFWITHDSAVLRYCSRVIVLDKGSLVFSGTPDEFSAWNGDRSYEAERFVENKEEK